VSVPELGTQVAVVGAGPVGLMLAGELRLAGVSVVVVDRLAAPMTESRAAQLNTRTAELLHERGMDELLAEAQPEPKSHFGGLSFGLSTVDSLYAGNWKVPQYRTEAALTHRALGLGAELLRAHELHALTDTGDGVSCELTSPAGELRLHADFVVGCDGEDSTVRRLAGFEFAGMPATRELLRADVTGIDIPDRRFERFEHGLAVASTRQGVTRVMVHELGRAAVARTEPPTFAEITRLWAKVTGEDIAHGTAVWVDAFDNARGQAAQYRRGRVLLAGDAAHRHLPIGGQALNIGLQDAANLGWKLGATVAGWAPSDLLDTYHEERHPVGARILNAVVAQEELLLGGLEVEPLRAVLAELLALPEAQAHLAGLTSGLDVQYGSGDHPLVGLRLPDLPLLTESGAGSTAEFLQQGKGILLDLTAADPGRTVAPWASRVHLVRSLRPAGDRPERVLLRPDGYVAWAGGGEAGLEAALRRWFGEPAQPKSPTRPDEELRPS
jgi:2-polyprenyl-6-methoxyphenol hydroxylase-like FAD-dependent oxidoreductase